jgi:hypothetical protein
MPSSTQVLQGRVRRIANAIVKRCALRSSTVLDGLSIAQSFSKKTRKEFGHKDHELY